MSRFNQTVCSLSVRRCVVHTRSPSRLPLLRSLLAPYCVLSFSSTGTLTTLTNLQHTLSVIPSAHLQRLGSTLLNHIVFHTNQLQCSSSSIRVQVLSFPSNVIVITKVFETNQSLLTPAILVFLVSALWFISHHLTLKILRHNALKYTITVLSRLVAIVEQDYCKPHHHLRAKGAKEAKRPRSPTQTQCLSLQCTCT